MALSKEQLHHHIAERDRLGADDYAFTAQKASDAAYLFAALGASLYQRQPIGKRMPVTVKCALRVEFIGDDTVALAMAADRYVQAIRTALSRIRAQVNRNAVARPFECRYERWDRFTDRPEWIILTLKYVENDAFSSLLKDGAGPLQDFIAM